MRYFIDANLSRSAVEVLQMFRHHVAFARDFGLAVAGLCKYQAISAGAVPRYRRIAFP